uniref:Transmembrane protein 50B n=1 Tax=Panagrellus redivivus TaxID=6233 RepID=A0A7E4V6B2_PANRE
MQFQESKMSAACLEFFPFLNTIEWENHRNKFAAIGSGVLFFGSVWLMIDTSVAYSPTGHWSNVYFLLTLAGSIAFFMINAVSNHQVTGQAMDEGILGTKGARLWMMFAFFLAFSTLVASLWIMFANFVLVEGDIPNWPGLALFFHSFFIFISSLLYKFGRSEEMYG